MNKGILDKFFIVLIIIVVLISFKNPVSSTGVENVSSSDGLSSISYINNTDEDNNQYLSYTSSSFNNLGTEEDIENAFVGKSSSSPGGVYI